MTNVINRVRKYFVDKGLKTKDIPKALVIHEMMGILMLALTWNASYRWPMSSNPAIWNPIKGLLSKVPTNALSKVSSGIKALPLPPKVTEVLTYIRICIYTNICVN